MHVGLGRGGQLEMGEAKEEEKWSPVAMAENGGSVRWQGAPTMMWRPKVVGKAIGGDRRGGGESWSRGVLVR